MNMEMAETSISQTPSFDWCQLCDEQQVVNFCKSCTRVLCETCTKVHITDTCKEEHALEIVNLKQQQQRDFKSIKGRIASAKVNLEANSATKLDGYEKEKASLTEQCLEARQEIIKQLEEHFDKQKKKIGDVIQSQSKNTQEASSSINEELEKLTTELSKFTEKNYLDLALTWENAKCKVLKKLNILEQASGNIADDIWKIEAGNTELNASAFDPNKAFFIPSENLTGDDERRGNREQKGPATFEWMTKGPLKLVNQTEIHGTIDCMKICKGRLWCLMLYDHIKICDLTGNVVQIINIINEGISMATVMDEYVVLLCKAKLQVYKHNGEKLEDYDLTEDADATYTRAICSQGELFFVIAHRAKRVTTFSTTIGNATATIESFSISHNKLIKNSMEGIPCDITIDLGYNTYCRPDQHQHYISSTKEGFFIINSGYLCVVGFEAYKFKLISRRSSTKQQQHLIGYRYDMNSSEPTKEVFCNETFTSLKICEGDGKKPLILGSSYRPVPLSEALNTNDDKPLFFGEDYKPRKDVKICTNGGKPVISECDCYSIISQELTIHEDRVTVDLEMKEFVDLPSDEIQGATWVTCDNVKEKMYVAVKQGILKPSIIKIFSS